MSDTASTAEPPKTMPDVIDSSLIGYYVSRFTKSSYISFDMATFFAPHVKGFMFAPVAMVGDKMISAVSRITPDGTFESGIRSILNDFASMNNEVVLLDVYPRLVAKEDGSFSTRVVCRYAPLL